MYIMEEEKEEVDSMLLNVQALSREGRLAEAKAAMLVLRSLYPLNADIHFEHWKVSCRGGARGRNKASALDFSRHAAC